MLPSLTLMSGSLLMRILGDDSSSCESVTDAFARSA
jgi:hypothetical protein